MAFVKDRDPLQSQFLKLAWVAALKQWLKWFLALTPSNAELLVIQGEGDTTVDWRYNLKIIREKFPLAQFFQLQQAKHHLVGEAEAIRGLVFQAIERYLEGAPLPDIAVAAIAVDDAGQSAT
jgi:alpha-beta hydrolase superfamily lysophospholipase